MVTNWEATARAMAKYLDRVRKKRRRRAVLPTGKITIRRVRKASDKEVLAYLREHPNESLADVVEATAYDIGQVKRLMKKRRR